MEDVSVTLRDGNHRLHLFLTLQCQSVYQCDVGDSGPVFHNKTFLDDELLLLLKNCCFALLFEPCPVRGHGLSVVDGTRTFEAWISVSCHTGLVGPLVRGASSNHHS